VITNAFDAVAGFKPVCVIVSDAVNNANSVKCENVMASWALTQVEIFFRQSKIDDAIAKELLPYFWGDGSKSEKEIRRLVAHFLYYCSTMHVMDDLTAKKSAFACAVLSRLKNNNPTITKEDFYA
jgi:hypothetical protein